MAAHYAATGEVRFRAPYSDEIEFRISAPIEGSLDFPYKVVSKVAGAVADRRLAAALFLALLSRSTGQELPPDVAVEMSSVNSGDLDAMAEAAAPGMMRAHRWIDKTGKSIMIEGETFSDVSLDMETKEYLQTELVGSVTTQDVTVAAVNANSKTGRVYFEDLGRTVPFKVSRDATGRTMSNLSLYLNHFIDKSNEWVAIKFNPILFADDRLKSVMILDCALASQID